MKKHRIAVACVCGALCLVGCKPKKDKPGQSGAAGMKPTALKADTMSPKGAMGARKAPGGRVAKAPAVDPKDRGAASRRGC